MDGRRWLCALAAGFLAGGLAEMSPATAAHVSAVTGLGDRYCKVTHTATRDPGGRKLKRSDYYPDRWRCPGYRGLDVFIVFDDEREGIAFGRTGRPAGEYLFHGHFGGWRPTVEWRGPSGPDGIRPVAAIVHYRWDIPDDPSGIDHGDDIVVIRLGADAASTCILAKIDAGANPDADALARRYVDHQLPARPCVSGQPPERLGRTR